MCDIKNEEHEDETYELIIHTRNVKVAGGEYTRYHSVVEHTEEAHGVRIETEQMEVFHPWTFDGGIDALVVLK